MKSAAFSLSLALLSAATCGHEAWGADTGEFDDEAPLKDFFRSSEPAYCCSEADGHRGVVRKDEQGRWQAFVEGQWRSVPSGGVIKTPSPFKTPVVWYYHQDGVPVVRCIALNTGI